MILSLPNICKYSRVLYFSHFQEACALIMSDKDLDLELGQQSLTVWGK